MVEHTISRFEETAMGLPYPVTLVDSAELIVCGIADDEYAIAIPGTKELAKSLALTRCFQPMTLSGREIQFLRKVIEFPIKQMAARLSMSPEQYRLMETQAGVLNPQDYPVDFMIRSVVVQAIMVSQENLPKIDYCIPTVEARVRKTDSARSWPTWDVVWKYPS